MKRVYPMVWVAALLVGGGSAAPALAQAPDAAARQREHIAAERAAAETRYSEQRRNCLQRFVATPCLEEAKGERRDALARARREQNELEDSLRTARALDRTEAIRKRAFDQAEKTRDEAPPEPAAAERRSAAERAPKARSEPKTGSKLEPRPKPHRLAIGRARVPADAASSPSSVPRKDLEARSRATFDAAQRAAEAHRAEVEQRNARHAATHKPVSALPLPRAASAP